MGTTTSKSSPGCEAPRFFGTLPTSKDNFSQLRQRQLQVREMCANLNLYSSRHRYGATSKAPGTCIIAIRQRLAMLFPNTTSTPDCFHFAFLGVNVKRKPSFCHFLLTRLSLEYWQSYMTFSYFYFLSMSRCFHQLNTTLILNFSRLGEAIVYQHNGLVGCLCLPRFIYVNADFL